MADRNAVVQAALDGLDHLIMADDSDPVTWPSISLLIEDSKPRLIVCSQGIVAAIHRLIGSLVQMTWASSSNAPTARSCGWRLF